MSVDIESNILRKIRKSGKFALQVDESTDISEHAHLLANVRFINEDVIKKTFSFTRDWHMIKPEKKFLCCFDCIE